MVRGGDRSFKEACWFLLAAGAILYLLGAAFGTPPQCPLPLQAPPLIKPYCLCWRDGHCDCGACPCLGGKKQLTSTHGRKVWFRREAGYWVPDESGWVYDDAAQGWRKVGQHPVRGPVQFMPSYPAARGFGSPVRSGGGSSC